MRKYDLYDISADGGRTWTRQWLTESERDEHIEKYGYIVVSAKAHREVL